MSLRGRLARLERALAPPPAPQALVVVCRHVSHFADGRAAGVYRDDPLGGDAPHVAFDGHGPDEALLGQLRADRGTGPLFVVIGPNTVPPPA